MTVAIYHVVDYNLVKNMKNILELPEVIFESRIYLKKPRLEDADQMSIMLKEYHSKMYKNLDWPESFDKMHSLTDNINQIIKDFDAKKRFVYHVFEYNSDLCIGRVGYFKFNVKQKQASIGFWCFPAFEGRGLMKDAVGTLIVLGIKHGISLKMEIKKNNQRALSFAESLGFSIVTDLDQENVLLKYGSK